MTVRRLAESDVLFARRFSVAGGTNALSSAVTHVGILDSDQEVSWRTNPSVVHSGGAGRFPRGAARGSMAEVRALGHLVLNDGETRALSMLLETVVKSSLSDGYCVLPSIIPPIGYGPVSDTPRKFSCSGLVQFCYTIALTPEHVAADGKWRCLVEESSIPPASLDSLASIFGPGVHRAASRFGLSGNGPWPVLLPEHVVSAFDRPDHEIRERPYSP